jgi:hypothetical protein
MVKIHQLPNGDPFAIVIEDDTQARTSVAADGSSVTVILRQPGMMPCSLIFPELVAAQVFGPHFAATSPQEPAAPEDGYGTGGGV